jgi:hypothetical protein
MSNPVEIPIVPSTDPHSIPRIRQRDPEQGGLLVRVDLGYFNPECTFELLLSPTHTFRDFSAAIEGVMGRWDTGHLASFFFDTDHRIREHPRWDVKAEVFLPEVSTPVEDMVRTEWLMLLDEHEIENVPEDVAVSTMLGAGHQCWYRFDWGDAWDHSIRVVRAGLDVDPALPVAVTLPSRIFPQHSMQLMLRPRSAVLASTNVALRKESKITQDTPGARFCSECDAWLAADEFYGRGGSVAQYKRSQCRRHLREYQKAHRAGVR